MAKSPKSKASPTPVETIATAAVVGEPAAAPAKPKKKAKAAPVAEASVVVEPAPSPAPTHDEVRRRAYELWLAHGGSSMENWLAAERQLRG